MKRLVGLDVARFLALTGMIVVNFNVVMTPQVSQMNDPILNAFQGRAAALFVILAGIGLGLAARNQTWIQSLTQNAKRAVLLMITGLMNALVFQPDIIHYYAVYFMLGALMLPMTNRQLSAIMVTTLLISLTMIMTLDYDRGWNWQTLHYTDFWSTGGFIRNLLFNGWHPVFPWVCFLLLGIQLSRLELAHRTTQWRLLSTGVAVCVIVELLSAVLQGLTEDTDVHMLLSTGPIPPLPLYLLSSGGMATAVMAGCLLITTQRWGQTLWSVLTPVGRQTLTWYILHIYLGMGLIEAITGLGNSKSSTALWAALGFMMMATLLSRIWAIWFALGPLEWVMKRLSQSGSQ